MRIEINPQYDMMREWITALPTTFATQGEVIYDARNQIRVIDSPWGKVNVKRYCQPNLFNRFIYLVRRTKAERAYRNAFRLRQYGIDTPETIGYILCNKGLIKESYLVTRQMENREMLYMLGDGKIEGRETMLDAFAKFAAKMHDCGVLHKDFSPGNILTQQVDGEWQFALVDINRIYFGKVGAQKGCRNFARLWGTKALFEYIAPRYAQQRHLSPTRCLHSMLKARSRFWRHRHPEKLFRYEL
mgnify:CR=1 FL=1